VIARAKGGSILFDEVGDLGEAAQGKIVRMLDALGDAAPRVMATSQKDLMERMEAGAFRQDLFYRLGGVTIAVPSLRERVDDIPLLANHFLARAERDGITARRFADDAMELIRAYSWPGNVRQLENTIRRLTVTSPAEEITRAEIEMVLGSQPAIEPLMGGGVGRQAVGLGRKAPAPLLRSAWRGVAAAGPLRPDPARSGDAADRNRAGGDGRQSG
jgi:two-component system nitrogen regulation response regulator GlnG